MRLRDWMKRERYRDKDFVQKINEILARDGFPPYTWQSVRAWRNGVCIPRTPVLAAIAEFTHDEVTYADHVAENAPHRVRPSGKIA